MGLTLVHSKQLGIYYLDLSRKEQWRNIGATSKSEKSVVFSVVQRFNGFLLFNDFYFC